MHVFRAGLRDPCIYVSESRTTSQVRESRNPAWKTIW
jgi:hypothetical protein